MAVTHTVSQTAIVIVTQHTNQHVSVMFSSLSLYATEDNVSKVCYKEPNTKQIGPLYNKLFEMTWQKQSY